MENVRYNLDTHALHGNYHTSSDSNKADELSSDENVGANEMGEPPASMTDAEQNPPGEENEVSVTIDPGRESLLKEAKEIFFAETNLVRN